MRAAVVFPAVLAFSLAGSWCPAWADGGATVAVAVATYLKAEAANFAAQAAEGWFVSYGPIVREDGEFEMTFKNEIRYGPGGIGKETWWVDIKGNLESGSYSVKGRGSTAVSWIDWYRDGMVDRVAAWQAQYKRLSGKKASAPKRWVSDRPVTVTASFTNRAPYGVDFKVNGSGPLSTNIHLNPKETKSFNINVSAGFKPYVKLREPDGNWTEYRILADNAAYGYFIDANNQLGFIRDGD